MKVILKIDEYLQEKNSVVVKTCRLYSHKSIDEFGAKVVNCDDLNMTDCETFIESLVIKYHKIVLRHKMRNRVYLNQINLSRLLVN